MACGEVKEEVLESRELLNMKAILVCEKRMAFIRSKRIIRASFNMKKGIIIEQGTDSERDH